MIEEHESLHLYSYFWPILVSSFVLCHLHLEICPQSIKQLNVTYLSVVSRDTPLFVISFILHTLAAVFEAPFASRPAFLFAFELSIFKMFLDSFCESHAFFFPDHSVFFVLLVRDCFVAIVLRHEVFILFELCHNFTYGKFGIFWSLVLLGSSHVQRFLNGFIELNQFFQVKLLSYIEEIIDFSLLRIHLDR